MSGNGLSPLYITGVDLNQYFVSNQTGEALANGVLYFYADSNRTQAKNVYELVQGSGSPPNYTYLPLPNPLTLSAVGTIVDASGNNCALYYYPYDAYRNVQLYYVECFDAFGNLQFTREAWPYLSTTGGGMSGSINSAAQNSIAWYATTGTTISGIPPVNSSIMTTTNAGVPQWSQSLPSQVQLQIASFNSGTGASNTTFWRGDGTWATVSSGILVQRKSFQTGTFAVGAGTMPNNSIPQNTDGNEYMSLSITPLNAANILVIEVWATMGSTNSSWIIGALFQDSTANALTASSSFNALDIEGQVRLTYVMTAGTNVATTFKFRAGGKTPQGGTNFNGVSGSQSFGGVANSGMLITEYTS